MRTNRSRPRRWNVLSASIASVLIGGGTILLVATATAPEAVERVYGDLKTLTIGTVDKVRAETRGDLPTVDLGATGDMTELDRCDGTFTEMASYEHDDVPPVWAAHNNCLGDMLLPWEVGQQIQVEGSDQVYEVVDVRHTPKTWGTVDDLVGIEGDLALQTCFYGEDEMKFVGLRPVD